MTTNLSTLPVGVLIALGVLVVIELTLDVISLVDLYRRPIERVALGNKWVWVVIVVLVNLLGSILYLAVGRKTAPVTEGPAPTRAEATNKESIADTLYGPRSDAAKPGSEDKPDSADDPDER